MALRIHALAIQRAIDAVMKRPRPKPTRSWYAKQSAILDPLVEVRRRWENACHRHPTPFNKARRTEARMRLKQATREAKTTWRKSRIARLPDGPSLFAAAKDAEKRHAGGALDAWKAVKELKSGHVAPTTVRPTRFFKADDSDELTTTTRAARER